jgi:hypothetical protein
MQIRIQDTWKGSREFDFINEVFSYLGIQVFFEEISDGELIIFKYEPEFNALMGLFEKLFAQEPQPQKAKAKKKKLIPIKREMK